MNDQPDPWPTGRHAPDPAHGTGQATEHGNNGGLGGVRGVLLGAAVLLAVAVAALAIVQWAGDTDTAAFERGAVADVIGAAGRAGLQVCSVDDEPDPLAQQATSLGDGAPGAGVLRAG